MVTLGQAASVASARARGGGGEGGGDAGPRGGGGGRGGRAAGRGGGRPSPDHPAGGEGQAGRDQRQPGHQTQRQTQVEGDVPGGTAAAVASGADDRPAHQAAGRALAQTGAAARAQAWSFRSGGSLLSHGGWRPGIRRAAALYQQGPLGK